MTPTADDPPPLYPRVMGADFDRLPPAVRRLHHPATTPVAAGRARVRRGRHPLAQLICAAMRLPRTCADTSVEVRFSERDGVETWVRTFGERSFSSELSQGDGLLIERFGPIRFGFELTGGPAGLAMHFRRWRLGPFRLPAALGPSTCARETEQDGAFHFEVAAFAPLVGLVISYKGWLKPA